MRPTVLLVSMSAVYAAVLPVLGLGAAGSLAALAIEVSGATPGVAGPGLLATLLGLLLLLLPVGVLVSLVVMWAAFARGNDGLARRAAMWPLGPLAVGLLSLTIIWLV